MNEWEQAPVVGAEAKADWQAAPVVKAAGAAPKPKTPEDKPGFFSRAGGALREGIGGILEPPAAMVSGAVAKPIADVAGLGAIPLHAAGAIKTEPQQVQESVQRGGTYQPKTQMGKLGTEYNPLALIGKLIGAMAGKAGEIAAPPQTSGPLRAAAGSGLEELIKQLPMFAGLKAPAAAGAMGTALKGAEEGAGKFTARGLMQSALKPGVEAQRAGKAGTAIDTMLDEGINVSHGGLSKLHEKIDSINTQIADKIKNSKAVVNKTEVANRLQGTMDDFMMQVDQASDVKTIQGVWDRFLEHPLLNDEIPVATAQAMKQRTYRSLKDKAYGELKSADIEAQKTLARGLKEEIAKAVPEVAPLNAQDSKLLTTLPLVERRVLMEANKNPAGLGILSLNPTHFALWMADRSSLFKSLVARMLNKASGDISAAGVAGPPLGMMLPSQAEKKPNQIQNPPQ